MKVKTLKLSLGKIKPLQALPPSMPSGWYIEAATGQELYWDAATQKFYTPVNGLLVPLGFTTWPGTVLSVAPGESVAFVVTFGYTGPALTGVTLVCQIGSISADLIFNELASNSLANITLAQNLGSTPTQYSKTVSVALPSTGVNADWTAIKAQMTGGSPDDIGGNEVTYQNALNIVGLNATITGFNITNIQLAAS